MITTVLGSCISACIRDSEAGIGGMNHFMLPIERRIHAEGRGIDSEAASRYGNFAMELLINEILKAGGKRKNLEVKLFGGGKVVSSMHTTDIGKQNILFAHQYLDYEGLPIIAEDTGDIYPRKVHYFPITGRVRVRKLINIHNTTVNSREDEYYSSMLEKSTDEAEVEIFKR